MTPNCKINRIHSADVLVDVTDNIFPIYAFMFRKNSETGKFTFRTYGISNASVSRLAECLPRQEVSVSGENIVLAFDK